jgi:hypothetical protein
MAADGRARRLRRPRQGRVGRQTQSPFDRLRVEIGAVGKDHCRRLDIAVEILRPLVSDAPGRASSRRT